MRESVAQIDLPPDVMAEKITGYHAGMFAICFAGNILAGSASTLMSVYLPVVVGDLLGSVDDVRLNDVSAYINSLYFVGWAIGGLMWGIISDRIGRARSLALAISMYGLFTLLKSFAGVWELILVFQFFCGFGVGGVLVVNTTLLSEVWPVKTRAVFIGILSTGFPIGIFMSGTINFFLADWRTGFGIGVIPLVLGIFSFWLLRESEQWKSVKHQKTGRKHTRAFSKELLFGSIIFGSMLIGLWAVFSWVPTWVQSLLVDADGQDERSLSMMALGIGGLSGGFCSGWISNVWGTRKVMLVCFAGCFVFSALLFKGNTSFTTVTIIELSALSFMFGVSQGLLGVYIPLLFPVSIRATATGFCFNVGRFVTAAAVFFIGVLVSSLGGYGDSLFIFSFVFVIGFIFLLLNKNSD